MRYAFRHGPSQGRHPTDTLVRPVTEHIPRVDLAGKYGWCCLCTQKDVQGVTTGIWTNPISGAQVEIAVCARHRSEVDHAP